MFYLYEAPFFPMTPPLLPPLHIVYVYREGGDEVGELTREKVREEIVH